jgi:hypothetical protein
MAGSRRTKGRYVRLGVRLSLGVLLALNLTPNHILADIILLAQVEELANLGGALGSETLGEDDVGEPGDVVLALLDDDEREDGDVGADDAATHGLALALAGAADAVAGVAVGEEEADTVRHEDALLHGEALLVVAAADAEDVALPFVAEGVAGDFLRHFLVVEDAATFGGEVWIIEKQIEYAQTPLIVDIDQLLGPSCGVWQENDQIRSLSPSTVAAY